tara:strand:+ start:2144 stop:2413 length:270 start_codon:yes stop_codon:yes gene_type:complete
MKNSPHEFVFLNESFELWCDDKDLLFFVNIMAIIELHGSSYLDKFHKLNNYVNYAGYNNKVYIPSGMLDHIDKYLTVYEREENINNVLL